MKMVGNALSNSHRFPDALDADNEDPVQEEQAEGDASERRDAIVQAMWEDYLAELTRQGHGPPT